MSEHAVCFSFTCAVEPHKRQQGILAYILVLCYKKHRLHYIIEIFFNSSLTETRAPKRREDLGRKVMLLGNLAIQIVKKV